MATSSEGISRAVVILTTVDAVVCLGFGIVHPLVGSWDKVSDRLIFGVLVGGGGALMVAGLSALNRSPWGSAALIAAGAVAGVIGLFWLILVPLLAIVLVPLVFIRARRVTAPVGPAPQTPAGP